MMGPQKKATEKLFYYNISIEKRIPKDHILRRVAEVVDFGFVRQKVESYYGYNGHESEDPIVVLKLMFLLFFENVKSERELLRTLPMRLDWLWFLGLDLDSEVPHHSVLSKARKRWGAAVFEQLFVQVVGSCVEAGLVEGRKIHMDGSLVDADASQKSVICGAEELIAALKRSYGVQERKLEAVDEEEAGEEYQKKNRQLVSRTDPDAAETVVADSQYGTNENFAWCGNRGVEAHMGDVLAKRSSPVFWSGSI